MKPKSIASRHAAILVASLAAPGVLQGQLLQALTVTADGAPEGVLVERIEYLSDGLRVVGYRAAPTVGSNLPVVIENRGGNRDFGQWTDAAAVSRLGRMAGWGYLVLASQYRGVDGGEGQEEFGGADVNDVLSLLPIVESDPRADTARIGMVGWSRGGMTTYLVLRRTNRIKAAVLGSAIADLFQTAENRPPMEQNVFSELIPDYWETREQALSDRSAIHWVDQLPKQTPLLLLQGSADWRVDPTQTLRMAAALFEAMHPFRLVFFEGGDHGLTEYRTEVDDLTRHWLDTYVRDRQPWPSLEPHGN